MKYYNLYIHFEPSWDTYNRITEIIGQQPQEYKQSHFEKSNIPSTWWIQLNQDEEDSPIDFINVFMDLLEPNFEKLNEIGIRNNDIVIWLVYEYDKQCSMEFDSEELERIGRNSITLCIDCLERK